MKRIWVAIALLIICVSFAATEYIIVDKNYQSFSEALEISKEYFSDKEYSKSHELLNTLLKKWEDSEGVLNIFLSHTKVDEIEESLSELASFANAKEKSHFYSTFEKTKRQLLCLKQSELPNLENIM